MGMTTGILAARCIQLRVLMYVFLSKEMEIAEKVEGRWYRGDN